MVRLIQTICLIFLIGMVFSWPYPLLVDRQVPVAFVHASIEEGSSSSIFDEMNRMLASMHERFEHMFGWPKVPLDIYDPDYDLLDANHDDELILPNPLLINDMKTVNNVDDIQHKLDALQPVCTTVIDIPPTVSPRKSRRKKLPTTKTTTCIKELIQNGQKHFSEEITTTDDKGVIIKQSQSYGAVSVDTNQIQQ